MMPPLIDMELQQYHTAASSATAYKKYFRELVTNKYQGYKQFYTDGSKDRDGVGAAVVAEEVEKRAAIPRKASIFSAELHAI